MRKSFYLLLVLVIAMTGVFGLFQIGQGTLYPVPEPASLNSTIPAPSLTYLPAISCHTARLYTGNPPSITVGSEWQLSKTENGSDPYLYALVEYTQTGGLLFGSQTFVLSTTTGASEGYAGVINQDSTSSKVEIDFPITHTLLLITGTLPEYHLFYLDRNVVADVYGKGIGKSEIISEALEMVAMGANCGH